MMKKMLVPNEQMTCVGLDNLSWTGLQYNTIQYNTLYLTRVNILTFYSFLTYGPQNKH